MFLKLRCINAVYSVLHSDYETLWFPWFCLLGLMFLYAFGLFSFMQLVIGFIEQYSVHTTSSLQLRLERDFQDRRLIIVTHSRNGGQVLSLGVSRRQLPFLCPPFCHQPTGAVWWAARRVVSLVPFRASICMTRSTVGSSGFRLGLSEDGAFPKQGEMIIECGRKLEGVREVPFYCK